MAAQIGEWIIVESQRVGRVARKGKILEIIEAAYWDPLPGPLGRRPGEPDPAHGRKSSWSWRRQGPASASTRPIPVAIGIRSARQLPRGLRCAFEWHAPADQLAAEIVGRALTGCATRAAPMGEAAVVGQEG